MSLVERNKMRAILGGAVGSRRAAAAGARVCGRRTLSCCPCSVEKQTAATFHKALWLSILLTQSLLWGPLAHAQSGALQGTWSGSWLLESGGRDSVTLRFSRQDGSIVGEMLNPAHVTLDEISFDSQRLSLVAEAEHHELGEISVEGGIEEETRLNGTLRIGQTRGEMRLTKWTFVPRAR
jgi:hypothetical protein